MSDDDKEQRAWRKKDAQGDDLIAVWKRRPAHSDEFAAAEIIERLEHEFAEAEERAASMQKAAVDFKEQWQRELARPSLATLPDEDRRNVLRLIAWLRGDEQGAFHALKRGEAAASLEKLLSARSPRATPIPLGDPLTMPGDSSREDRGTRLSHTEQQLTEEKAAELYAYRAALEAIIADPEADAVALAHTAITPFTPWVPAGEEATARLDAAARSTPAPKEPA